jgi:hypothetical protein
MCTFKVGKRSVVSLFALLGILALPASASAQFIVNNPIVGGGIDRGFIGGGYGGYGGWGWGGWGLANVDPYGGYLYGAGQVIKAQGQFMIDKQKANILYQQAQQERVRTRRAIFDEWLYERENTPTIEDERQRMRAEELRRALNDPPLTEVWSGDALNKLLKSLQQVQSTGVRGPTVSLNQSLLQQVNVTPGSAVNTGANIGVLRSGQALSWPLALSDSRYDRDRNAVDQLVKEAVSSLLDGKLQPKTLRDLNTHLRNLETELRKQVTELPTAQYLDAKRYIGQVQNAVKALEQPDATNFFNSKWSAQGDDVASLVDYMTNHGLLFASATRGQESAYTALHRAFVNYYSGLMQVMGKR